MTTALWIASAIAGLVIVTVIGVYAVELIADKATTNGEDEADHPGTE